MDVHHIQLASKAPGGYEVMAGAEGADLGAPISANRAALAWNAVAVQHLNCRRRCSGCILKSLHGRYPRMGAWPP